MKGKAIGIDLGGTNIKAVLIDAEGNIIEKTQEAIVDNEKDEGKQWKEAIKAMVKTLQFKSGLPSVPVGLSAPGIPDKEAQCIAHMAGRLFGLVGFNWSEFVGIPHLPVLNDALAALIAESKIGAGKGSKDLLMITLGTGVGGGIMINGEIHRGFLQRAGHIGHISIDFHGRGGIFATPGNLEDAIGNSTIKERSEGRFETTKALVDAHLAGNHFATYLWLDSIKKLAVGIVSLSNAISPEKVILGGGISQAGSALLDPLNSFMDVYEWRPNGIKVPIVLAQGDAFAGAVGAAFYAMEA